MNKQQNYQRIWQTIIKIPVGKVASYGQIADLAGLPGRARLVGKALGEYKPVDPGQAQPVLPWYRVLRASGQLAFSKGSEQALHQTGLLQQENIVVLNNRVKLKDHQWQPDLAELLFSLEH